MSRVIATVFAIGLLLGAQLGHAADPSGQFPGVYVLEGGFGPVTDSQREALQLKCVLAPGVMHANGFGVGYFLDRELFRNTGAVSYIKGHDYRCRYVAATRQETCESREFSDGKSLTYYRNNVYQVFTPELQRGHSLLTPEDVVDWNERGKLNPDRRFAYHRCVCPTAEEIESRATALANPLSSEETGDKLFWWSRDATPDELDIARQVLSKLGGCRPDIS